MNHPWRVGTKSVLCFQACYVPAAPHVVVWCLSSLPFVQLPESPQKCKIAAKSLCGAQRWIFLPVVYLYVYKWVMRSIWDKHVLCHSLDRCAEPLESTAAWSKWWLSPKVLNVQRRCVTRGAQRNPLAIRKSACNESFQHVDTWSSFLQVQAQRQLNHLQILYYHRCQSSFYCFCLFLGVCVYVCSICSYVCIFAHRGQSKIGCDFYFAFCDRVSHWSLAQWFGKASWPVSTQESVCLNLPRASWT